MGGKFEVLIEKTERVCVVLEAEDESFARVVALEAERRGETVSTEDISACVVSCKAVGSR